ncbi:MAG: PDDEXK nuclease domain-containing protein [Desulfobacula sp.]|jgi:predicted nuclease of restriction endonuclease-like (RecB) superfamily
MTEANSININHQIYHQIRDILTQARSRVYQVVNSEMVASYWAIGRILVEEEQKGQKKAEYGKGLITDLAQKLSAEFGKGFDERNLRSMRSFYLLFPNWNAVRSELSWTHYRILLRVEKDEARSFYENEAVDAKWSTRELERQIASLLFERLALSRDKQGVLELARKGQEIGQPLDLVKDPYVLEFVGLRQEDRFLEKELEQALINRLKDFLLELGKGFAFMARQQRISLDGKHFYIDLVFYNRLTRSFVLIDLKVGELTHQDIGQMQMYVNYYQREMTNPGENPPIGIILCSEKSDAVVRFTLPEDNKQIFASRYKLYLPSEEELISEIRRERQLIELRKTDDEGVKDE